MFGEGSVAFYLFQTFTALILFLAANTSYNAFPRLAAILARGRLHAAPVLLPRRSPGLHLGIVILLAAVAISLLIVVFGGDTHP